jgi:hypothetical protein
MWRAGNSRTSTAASLWKPCFAEAIDINLRPLTAKSYIFGYSEIGINLKELDYRLIRVDFGISAACPVRCEISEIARSSGFAG